MNSLIQALWDMAQAIQGPVEYAETAGLAAFELERLTAPEPTDAWGRPANIKGLM